MVFWNKDLLFCEINPTCYAISMQKEILKRHLQDFRAKKNFARTLSQDILPNLVASRVSGLIKRGPGIDPVLQENKAVNIDLAAQHIHKIVIHPGEEFSFWKLVGKITKRKGYLDGRVIMGDKIEAGMGGGLCNLANTIHWVIVHSPMEITEFHTHSDALAPDEGPRQPFSNGTSISYNNIDYRFKNPTDQPVQLLVWCANENLYVELRSQKEFPYSYELVEEDHHFKKEGEKFYRNSKIYRETMDRQTNKILEKELILDNHSEVMFDYELIPKELIRES
ncbi:VanW family protein [Streptococcus cuniculipharyngis]|uniref:Vancomycin resistance protein n=1 Tax=Streptococcus cuniculipharyngis TaxID=1562651 RepID=A0A5C5SDQ2_9STRE|nr:VanW family protein [Streptococcus cuniculipharyngis]TWS98879.1 vancomycin resistance protein [Streptococcus cuniculipharyngis]